MGLRETLNENPGITTAATALIILAALVFVVVSMFQGGGAIAGAADKAFYSDDDGKSWFIDDATKVPPFERNGKQAVRAKLFTCDGGRTKFVGWLERFDPEAKKRMEATQQQTGAAAPAIMMEDQTGMGMWLKRPGTGEKGWVRNTDPAASEIILNVKCPDGSTDTLEAVPHP